jgi:hypothetical protein
MTHKKLPYNDTYGDELKSSEEEYHPYATFEAEREDLTPDQLMRMTEEEIIEHYIKVGWNEGFKHWHNYLVREPINMFLGLLAITKPELSYTAMGEEVRRIIEDDLKRATNTKQNIQQRFKGMRNDPVYGDYWENFLTRDSGEVKRDTPRPDFVTRDSSYDNQMRLFDD